MPNTSKTSSSELQRIDDDHIWHPFTPLQGVDQHIIIKKAKGVWLETADSKQIIDAVSSWWVNIHGHSHPHIANAISKQARELEHVIFAGFTHEPAIKLTKNLMEVVPIACSKVFFSDNGSTAIEVAIKMAIQYWHNKGKNKQRIIAIDGAYHGDTFGAMSVGERGDFTLPFFDYLFDVEFIDFPDGTNDDRVIHQFEQLVKSGDIGLFIFEPLVQGAAGMRMYRPELLDALMELAIKYDVITIADEVMTGFGRTGKLFACDYLANKPDIMCFSKGITGGALPLGLTACTEKIEAAFQTPDLRKAFLHGHSYTANPMACAAANASFDLLLTPECSDNIDRVTTQQKEFVAHIGKHSKIRKSRSFGTISAIEFETGEDTSYLSEMRNKIYPFFIERGVLLRPLGNLLYILPPYVITNEELAKVYSAIEEFLDTL